MKPAVRWDTSGETLRRVRVGETISYSSGKVPESGSLVREARQWAANIDAKPMEQWIKGYVLDGINYVEMLCDLLEEREREVERLRWFFENMREGDRRQLQMEYEQRNTAIERAVRERRERR